MEPQGVERRLAAILAADVAGYTRLMEADEAGTLAQLKAHRKELIDPTIAEHRGRIVKLMGDGMLVEFASAVDAVECAVDIQRGMAERNADIPEDRRIEFRIGINLGDVIVEGDDIYGDGVNVAARMQGLAEPGGIRISGNIHEQVESKLNYSYQFLGHQRVKNVAKRVRVYRVPLEPQAAGEVRRTRGAAPRKWLWAVLGVLLFLLMGGASLAIWERYVYSPLRPAAITILTDLNEHELTIFNQKILPMLESWAPLKDLPPFTVDVQNATSKQALKMLTKGQKIDIVMFDVNGNRRELVHPKELIHDLTDEKGLLPSAVHPTMAKYLEIDAKRYFIPFRGNVRLVFLNKSEYHQLKDECKYPSNRLRGNLSDELIRICRELPDLPRTWQDVRNIAELFRKRDNEERVAIAATKSDKALLLYELIRTAAGEPCDMTDDQVESLREVVEFVRNGLWPHVKDKSREFDWRTAGGFLLSESVYLARDWNFSLATLDETDRAGNFEVYEGLTWKEATPYYLLGGDFLALPKSARHPRLAKELMRFLVSRDVQRTLVEELSWPAIRMDAVSRSENSQQDRQARVNRALLHAEPLPNYWTQQVRESYEHLFDEITDAKNDVDDVMVEVKKINKGVTCRLDGST